MRGPAPWLLAVLVLGCARPVRVQRLEQPVETGLEVPFVVDGERRWDFGDGSPASAGAGARHAFHRAGTFTVSAFEGDALRETFTVVVVPRGVFHLVPPDVQWAVAARGLEELAPAVDFAERLGGAEGASRWLDAHPLLAWAVDGAAAGGSPVDPREGVAHFAWPDDGDTRVSVVGVTEPGPAFDAAAAWLLEHGWEKAGESPGFRRFAREGESLDVFVDRGALYGVETPLTERRPGAHARIAAADARGLEADGTVAEALDALPSGGLALVATGPGDGSWRFATGAIRVKADEARLEGTLHGAAPLWSAPAATPNPFLSRAPAGPVVVASAALRPAQLASLLFGTPGSPRRKRLDEHALTAGTDLQQGIDGLGDRFEAALYFDTVGFVRSTLAAGGRPAPEGTLLFEAPVSAAAPVEALVEVLARRAGLPAIGSREEGVRAWRGAVAGRPVELALTPAGLFARAGAPLDEREPVDLRAELGQRYEGAFTPGHVSLLVDIGQLRRELTRPRLISGVDPRRALTAQALAVTFLDRLTTLDEALVDVAPVPGGAAVQAVLRLRPRP